MRKLLIVAIMSLVGLGLGTPRASALWPFNCNCRRCSATICCKPYNAFSPCCPVSIRSHGCCPLLAPFYGPGYGCGAACPGPDGCAGCGSAAGMSLPPGATVVSDQAVTPPTASSAAPTFTAPMPTPTNPGQ